MKITNQHGTELDFDAATILMDDEIREDLHNIGYDDEKEFFAAYESNHIKIHGIEWELSKRNPTW